MHRNYKYLRVVKGVLFKYSTENLILQYEKIHTHETHFTVGRAGV